ncbi:MDR family MFS transporter [Candidatus Chlorohelix sp.]|uniref:MDR family MFS transporter n=1 Tax=Candidatus Chlorohelix sp. TaxID=3139201 RepID=UPI00305C611C
MEQSSPKGAVASAHPGEIGRRLHGFALFSVLGALLLTLLLEALDQTIISTALPRIISTLQGFDRYTWSVTAYALASVTVIPIVGKLSDQFGRKWFLIIGSLIFLIGSVLAGAAQTMDQFIAFRALQGFGAGTGIALVFTVVGDIFPPSERGKWQGLFGSVYGIANLIGPTLGGWLTDNGLLMGDLVTETTRWRWVFYINMPIGFFALLGLMLYLPGNLSERSATHTGWAAIRRIDFLGAILVAAATTCLLLGLTWGSNQTYAWDSVQVVGILIAAGALYLLFVLAERFVPDPILPLNLLRNRIFTIASLLSMLQMMVVIGLIIYLPLFLQGILGESATNAGELITPLTLSSVVGAMVAGILVSRLGRYVVITIIAGLIMALGVFLIAQMSPTTAIIEAVFFMIIAGLGMGPFWSILTLSVQNSLPRSQLGVGTGAVRFFGQLGGVLGIAIVGTVVNNTMSSNLANNLPADAARYLPPQVLQFATNPQTLVNPDYRNMVIEKVKSSDGPNAQQSLDLLNQVFASVKTSFAGALQQGFFAVLLICVATILICFLFKEAPRSGQNQPLTAEVADKAEVSQGLF